MKGRDNTFWYAGCILLNADPVPDTQTSAELLKLSNTTCIIIIRLTGRAGHTFIPNFAAKVVSGITRNR